MSSRTTRKRYSSRTKSDAVGVKVDTTGVPKPDSTEGVKTDIQVSRKDDFYMSEDSLVASLITSDSQTELAPAIKSIFEQRKENEVIQSLSNFVSNREREIERICLSNFQEFIRSIDDLVVVRKNVEDLKNSLYSLNRDMQQCCMELISKTTELIELRNISQNIDSAIDTISTCQYILGLCAKVKEYVENKKFYPAIKLLDQLQQVHLKVISDYEFGKYLQKRFPLMKESIKRRVLDDVTNWLLTIRMKASEIGSFAMEQTKAEITLKDEIAKQRKKEASDASKMFAASAMAVVFTRRMRAGTFLPPKKSQQGGSPTKNSDAKKLVKITEVSVFEEVEVDFAPLYQCSYIFESIGEKEEFQKFYVENRRAQAKLALQLDAGQSFIDNYKTFLHNVAGFFIVEATVLQTSNDLISSYDVVSLWDMAITKVKALLQRAIVSCNDPVVLTDLKDFLLVFARTLRKFGYDPASISEFVKVTLRERYVSVASAQVTSKLAELLSKPEAYQPFTPTSAEMNELVTPHKLETLVEKGATTFPFSVTLCHLVGLVKQFIRDVSNFSVNLPAMENIVLRSTEVLLDLLTGILLSSTQVQLRKERNITQIAQALVNCHYFEKTVALYEEYIREMGITHVHVNHHPAFQNCLQKLEELIYRCNEIAIDEEFDNLLATLDVKSDKKPTPREYISKIINKILSEFPRVNSLPPSIYEQMYHRAYKHIADRMMDLLASDKVKSWTYTYITNLNEDLTLVEDSLKKAPFAGLLEYFGELRQIIDLILSSDLLAYMNPAVRARLYPKILPRRLLTVLEKFREEGFTKLFVAGAKAKQIQALIARLKS